MTTRILFVCLGNICRSPLAEAAFRGEAERRGLEVEVESAGTGDWHVGLPPDRRAVAVAARNGVDIAHLRARVGRLPGMPPAGTGRIRLGIQAQPLRLEPESGLGQRRAADIAKTDEQNRHRHDGALVAKPGRCASQTQG